MKDRINAYQQLLHLSEGLHFLKSDWKLDMSKIQEQEHPQNSKRIANGKLEPSLCSATAVLPVVEAAKAFMN